MRCLGHGASQPLGQLEMEAGCAACNCTSWQRELLLTCSAPAGGHVLAKTTKVLLPDLQKLVHELHEHILLACHSY